MTFCNALSFFYTSGASAQKSTSALQIRSLGYVVTIFGCMRKNDT